MAMFLVSAGALQLGIFALAAFAIGFLIVGLRAVLVGRDDSLRARMQRSVALTEGALGGELADGPRVSSLIDAVLRPLAKVATPSDAQELAGLKAKLSHAGYRSEHAVTTFLGAKVAFALAGAMLVRLYASLQPEPPQNATMDLLVGMALGFYAPNLWLSGRATERKAAVNLALPDAMDLLVTCVEAGLALEGAIMRICSEIRLASPLLSAELSQAALEMRAGLTRSEAFRRLADRTGVEELKYLSSVISQAEVFGTSVAKSLRVMSESMRVRRTQTAEKNAATASVKMMIPLILCIMPSLFIVLLGPAVINIMRQFMPTVSG